MDDSELRGEEIAVLRGYLRDQLLQGDGNAPKTLVQRVFARLMASRANGDVESRRAKAMAEDFEVDERQVRYALKQIREEADVYFGSGGQGRGWLTRFELESRAPGRPSGEEAPAVNALVFRANHQPGWAMRKFLAPMLPQPGEKPREEVLLVHSETLALFDIEKQRFLWDSSLCSEVDFELDDGDELHALFRKWLVSGRLHVRERPGFETEAALRGAMAASLGDAGVKVETESGGRMRTAPHYERRHVILFGTPESNPALAKVRLPESLKQPAPRDFPVKDGRRAFDVHVSVARMKIDEDTTITVISAAHPAGYTALRELLEEEERFREVLKGIRGDGVEPLPREFQFVLKVAVNDRHELIGRGLPDVVGHSGFPAAAKKTAGKVVELQAPAMTARG